MRWMYDRLGLLALATLVLGAAGCASSGSEIPERRVGALPHVQADVEFMQGMIPHHAQAIVMASQAESHGARRDVLVLAQRIRVAQADEIRLMQRWLEDRGERVPPADATHHTMMMNGQEHQMLMPGMLSPEQMAELDAARGPEWDRLFLTYMIMHHQGAITMVDELFASYGAGQEDTIFRFASDVYADQSTEIERMYQMLDGG